MAGNNRYYDCTSLSEVLHEIRNIEIYHQFLFLLFPRPLIVDPCGLPLGLAEPEMLACLEYIQLFLPSQNSGRWNFRKQVLALQQRGALHTLHCRIVRLRFLCTILQYTQSFAFSILKGAWILSVAGFLPATDCCNVIWIPHSCRTMVSRKV